MALRRCARRVAAVAFAAGLALCTASAYDGERPKSPGNGEVYSSNVIFYIEASGRPAADEYYRIEVARDSKFQRIVWAVDSRKNKVGWMLGDSFAMTDVPEKYRPVDYEGIHFRTRGRLRDGEYYWRASKANGVGEWTLISGVQNFVVDTQPPAPVDSLRMRRLPDGGLQLWWSPVDRDAADNLERVAGYRIYRYDKALRRFPTMTRYLIKETDDTQLAIAAPPDPEEMLADRIVYYLVKAVDSVGNEEGRRQPLQLGQLEMAFDPPNLDQLTDPNYLRELNEAERPPD